MLNNLQSGQVHIKSEIRIIQDEILNERSYSLASSKIKVDKMPKREKTIGAKTI